MSIFKESAANCTKCGHNHKVVVYRSVNVSENPELKAAVKDGSVFMWTCPECGTRNLVRYEMLYHDPSRKLMLWLLPDEKLEEKAAEMAAIEKAVSSMGDYTLRRVSDVGGLIEKIILSDEGLDDLVIEMVKWVTLREMAEKDPSMEDVTLKFYKSEGEGDSRELIFSFPKDGAMVGCTVGWNVYSDCSAILERQAAVIPAPKGFARVDSTWMASILG